jgi:Protein of unknown function (DUF3102)
MIEPGGRKAPGLITRRRAQDYTMGNLKRELFEAGGVAVLDKPKCEPAAAAPKVETDLDRFATLVRAGVAEVRAALSNALDKALGVGDVLTAARRRIPEGQWRDWLEKDCELKTSTALLYMRIARHRGQIETVREKVPGLSIRGARKLIAAESKEGRQSPRQPKLQEDKPAIPDWVDAFNQASDEDKAAGIPHIITDLISHMTAAARADLERRVLGNAAEHARTKKQANAIREAQKPYLDGIPYSRIN